MWKIHFAFPQLNVKLEHEFIDKSIYGGFWETVVAGVIRILPYKMFI